MATYVPPPLTGYNVDPPPDDGSQVPENLTSWAMVLSKLTDRLKDWIDAINAQLVTSFSQVSLGTNTIGGMVPNQDPGQSTTRMLITAGACRDQADGFDIILASPIAKSINQSWTPGNLVGGFPSGINIANDTWYHVFVISNGSVTDAGYDSDVNAGNLLADSGYSRYRRVGSVYYTADVIYEHTAVETAGSGIDVTYTIRSSDFNSTTAQSNNPITLRTPLAVVTHPAITGRVEAGATVSSISSMRVGNGDGNSANDGFEAWETAVNGQRSTWNTTQVRTNTSSEIRINVVLGEPINGNTIWTRGYLDPRRS